MERATAGVQSDDVKLRLYVRYDLIYLTTTKEFTEPPFDTINYNN